MIVVATGMTVYGYVQVSGEGEGNIAALRQALKKYAEVEGLFLANVYGDVGSSGVLVDRYGLTALVSRLWLDHRARVGVVIPSPSHLSYKVTVRRMLERKITDTGAGIFWMYDNVKLPDELRP